jgi:predicted transporter
MAEERASRDRLFAVGFGITDLVSAAIVFLGVFVGLPARYWPVDIGASLVIAGLVGAGVGLLRRAKWGADVARAASMVVLALGLVLLALIAVSVSYLSGVYGPVGKGGALILTLAAALALPYLVALPVGQLLWLGPRRTTRVSGP